MQDKNNLSYMREWRESNKEKLRQYQISYDIMNKEAIKARQKAYYQRNKERIILKGKKAYREKNEVFKVKRKEYYERTKDGKRVWRQTKARLESNEIFRIKNKLRQLVYASFKRIQQNKPANTEELLGCSWIEAKEYFESLFEEGMSWDNHGEWHIDHIKPVNTFTELDDISMMNHISNLRPLWAIDNLSRPDDGSDINNLTHCCE